MSTVYKCDKCFKEEPTPSLFKIEIPTIKDINRRLLIDIKQIDLCSDCASKLAVKLLEFTR